jgi:NADH/F420H2 dehydrogenase subunit C
MLFGIRPGSNRPLVLLCPLSPNPIPPLSNFKSLILRPSRIRRCFEDSSLYKCARTACEGFSDVTAVDYYPNEPRYAVVYHILSLETFRRLRLKVQVSADDPKVESLVPVWPGADAFEREVFDLFGIHFEGHPYLRRILMPEDWEGHPLRKDYPTEGFR